MLKTALIALAVLMPCLAQKSSIEGLVTNLAGEPLKDTRVRLVFGTPPSSRAESVSNADGLFVLQDVTPGRYTLVAEHPGYLQSHPDLKLEAGQRVTGFVVKMTRASLVSGRVVDEDGDLVPTARIAILAEGEEGYPTARAQARADGSFVIGNLATGRYYLRAEDDPRPSGNGREVSGPQEALAATYYPGATELSKATLIPLDAGAEVRNLEIHLQKTRVFHIRGTVVDASSGAPVRSASLALRRDDPAANRMSALTAADGTFEFLRATPGKYALVLNRPARRNGATADLAGRLIVTVANDNVDGLVFPVSPGLTISGKATMEGAGPVEGVGVRFDFAEVDFNMHGTDQPSQKDGSFVIRQVEPVIYRVGVYGLPDGAYLKSIRWGDQDVTAADLDLTKQTAGKTVEILLSPHAAEVSGVVHDSKGDAAVDVQVVLRNSDGVVGGDRTDENGGFQFQKLAPGEYQVVAAGQPAVPVTLAEDSRVTIAIPKN
jgi:hypothetical protein